MKLLSLFDGSGTVPLAARNLGVIPVYASEIEPYCIRVTQKNFPDMIHLGDIRSINGADIEPCDIVAGGSPCTGLALCGRRDGLDDNVQSQLFYEMIRVIKEMGANSNGEYPKYVMWENVKGAFSSQKGYDFLKVLREFVGIADERADVPEPESKNGKLKWEYAGNIVGNGWSIAWRMLDAQYFGVAQRRKRCFLVLDLVDDCAAEILFEKQGVQGNTEQGCAERKDFASDDAGSTGRDRPSQPVMAFESHGQDSRYNYMGDKCETLTAKYGTGGGNAPIVVYKLKDVYVSGNDYHHTGGGIERVSLSEQGHV